MARNRPPTLIRSMSALGQKRKPSQAKIYLCPLLSESDQITDLAVLPCALTHSESWSRFRLWWLAWAAVERQDRQRASLSHGGLISAGRLRSSEITYRG
jgi:hypothetical protein